MYALTTRTPEDWQFKIIELMFNPASFAKVRIFDFFLFRKFLVFYSHLVGTYCPPEDCSSDKLHVTVLECAIAIMQEKYGTFGLKA
jgi:hypothetical protein